MTAPIDVIVPVYGAPAETKACIESVLESRPMVGCELVVVDDCSPDHEIVSYLLGLEAAGMLTLLRNRENRGFVASVNRGMRLHPERDVVLLNSDTIVANDWVERLAACCRRSPDIGTVTPFTNNGTICSYPRFGVPNTLPRDTTVAELDARFRRVNRDQVVEIPTAVGFCMFVNRRCLNQVGPFDEETFGRGYGEENDFCMRAMALGWRHLLCGDVFVAHRGGVSFGEARATQMAAAAVSLKRKHPQYSQMVHQHWRRDPSRRLRTSVDLDRLRTASRPRVLLVTGIAENSGERDLGQHIATLADSYEVLVLRPAPRGAPSSDGEGSDGTSLIRLGWENPAEGMRLDFDLDSDGDVLGALLATLAPERIDTYCHNTPGSEAVATKICRVLFSRELQDARPVR